MIVYGEVPGAGGAGGVVRRCNALILLLFATAPASAAPTRAQAAATLQQARKLVDRGLDFLVQGDLPRARDAFAAAQALAPEKANPYCLLARVDSQLENCEAALPESRRCVELTSSGDERRPAAMSIEAECLGQLQLAGGDLEAARKSFATAQAFVPDRSESYRLLALVDARLGRCADAGHESELFLRLAPSQHSRRHEVEQAECQQQAEARAAAEAQAAAAQRMKESPPSPPPLAALAPAAVRPAPLELIPASDRQPAPSPRPLLKRPWFWPTIVGAAAAVVTGITLGAVYGTSTRDPRPSVGQVPGDLR